MSILPCQNHRRRDVILTLITSYLLTTKWYGSDIITKRPLKNPCSALHIGCFIDSMQSLWSYLDSLVYHWIDPLKIVGQHARIAQIFFDYPHTHTHMSDPIFCLGRHGIVVRLTCRQSYMRLFSYVCRFLLYWINIDFDGLSLCVHKMCAICMSFPNIKAVMNTIGTQKNVLFYLHAVYTLCLPDSGAAELIIDFAAIVANRWLQFGQIYYFWGK